MTTENTTTSPQTDSPVTSDAPAPSAPTPEQTELGTLLGVHRQQREQQSKVDTLHKEFLQMKELITNSLQPKNDAPKKTELEELRQQVQELATFRDEALKQKQMSAAEQEQERVVNLVQTQLQGTEGLDLLRAAGQEAVVAARMREIAERTGEMPNIQEVASQVQEDLWSQLDKLMEVEAIRARYGGALGNGSQSEGASVASLGAGPAMGEKKPTDGPLSTQDLIAMYQQLASQNR